MDEKTLLKIALICSITGIFIIFIFANRLEPSLVNIVDISESFIDQDVKIRGKIVSYKDTASTFILDVRDETGKIKVITFDKEDFKVNKDQPVEILGEVKEYRGVLEVEAKKIIFI